MIDVGAFAGQIFVIVLLVVLAIFVIVVIFRSIRIIPQAYSGVVERLGRYQRTLTGRTLRDHLGLPRKASRHAGAAPGATQPRKAA